LSNTRQELEEELLELRQTIAAVVDIVSDQAITSSHKVREIRDVLNTEFDGLEDEEGEG
jgi:hypothetical protein